ncbi:hypothetical protein AAC387_Pa03g0402 [Persea americana]
MTRHPCFKKRSLDSIVGSEPDDNIIVLSDGLEDTIQEKRSALRSQHLAKFNFLRTLQPPSLFSNCLSPFCVTPRQPCTSNICNLWHPRPIISNPLSSKPDEAATNTSNFENSKFDPRLLTSLHPLILSSVTMVQYFPIPPIPIPVMLQQRLTSRDLSSGHKVPILSSVSSLRFSLFRNFKDRILQFFPNSETESSPPKPKLVNDMLISSREGQLFARLKMVELVK